MDKWDLINQTDYPVREEMIRTINGERVVDAAELMEIWGVGQQTLNKYLKAGMPKHNASIGRMEVFSLDAVKAWRGNTVSSRGTTKEVQAERTDDGPVGMKLKADADRAVEEAKIAELKRKNLEGSLVSSETLDIAQAELAVTYLTMYVNDKKVLPVQLSHRDSGFIREFLDDYYAKRMDDLEHLVNLKFPHTEETLYEIISLAIDLLRQGVPPDAITLTLGGVE